MKLFSSIEKKNKAIKIMNNKLSIYVCGPTVYNHVHIGNIRPIVVFDVLLRLLRTFKVDVNFVHNITDIDDKIIKQAKLENKTELEIGNYYLEHYKSILEKLNISKGIYFPKVSEHIGGIVKYIEFLVKKGFAYKVDGDVYFSIDKIKDYGIISNKYINDLEVGARIEENKSKKSPFDFVLWKETKSGLNWKTKFSYGRPGWHTECAYLINKYIGRSVDIHGGGVDLKFPHHENENAQNIALCNVPIAKNWVHVGHLTINDTKMSKSLNNCVYVKDLLEIYSGNAIRWFFYQTGYSNPINYADEYMEQAEEDISKIIDDINMFKSYLIINNELRPVMLSPSIFELLLNDLNIPNTITFINAEIKNAHIALRQKEYDTLNLKYNILYTLLNVLGINIENIHTDQNIDLLLKWDKLKSDRNFVQADVLRKELIRNKLI
ncbi:cysteine--tRNA ligase [Malacoplasma muris]|uniref:cysteine--tRNA ligase n=1 Tax=Malacoplasma muris TaxID=2119 RepID=UPI00398E657E